MIDFLTTPGDAQEIVKRTALWSDFTEWSVKIELTDKSSLVKTKSRVFPASWVGIEICWIKLNCSVNALNFAACKSPVYKAMLVHFRRPPRSIFEETYFSPKIFCRSICPPLFPITSPASQSLQRRKTIHNVKVSNPFHANFKTNASKHQSNSEYITLVE